MTKMRLNTKQLQELSEMLSAGKTTAEVASHFNISMATVHNHRTRLKRAGKSFPSKRGRKPKANPTAKSIKTEAKELKTSVKMESYNFIINGIKVSVSGKAKSVHIGASFMAVNF